MFFDQKFIKLHLFQRLANTRKALNGHMIVTEGEKPVQITIKIEQIDMNIEGNYSYINTTPALLKLFSKLLRMVPFPYWSLDVFH